MNEVRTVVLILQCVGNSRKKKEEEEEEEKEGKKRRELKRVFLNSQKAGRVKTEGGDQ